MTAKRVGVVCVAALVFVLGSFLPALAADQSEWDWNVNLFVGERGVGTDWTPFETYTTFGVETSWGKKDQPLLFAWDVLYSNDSVDALGSTQEVTSQTWEWSPGFRKFWVLKKRLIPYFGLGVTYATADYQYLDGQDVLVDSDHSWGFWLGGGFMFRAWSHLNLGIAARFEALRPFSIAGESRNGNSSSLGLVIGWGAKTESGK